MKKIITLITVNVSGILFAFAQSSNVGRQLENMILVFKQVSTLFYSSLFVVALILFFTGIMKYMAPGSNGESRKEGYKYMGFGIVAMFVMVSVWGLVAFIANTLGINTNTKVDVPTPPMPPTPPTIQFQVN